MARSELSTLQIDAVDNCEKNRASSSVEITDISNDTMPDLNVAAEQPSTKRMKQGKEKLVTDVSQVRRSNRIDGLAVGYKDVQSYVIRVKHTSVGNPKRKV
jgi:hypothetical protein